MEHIGLLLCAEEHITRSCLHHITIERVTDIEGKVFPKEVIGGSEDTSRVSMFVINWHAYDSNAVIPNQGSTVPWGTVNTS
jgi:hypothetical protein